MIPKSVNQFSEKIMLQRKIGRAFAYSLGVSLAHAGKLGSLTLTPP
jgi:hypothetical protein